MNIFIEIDNALNTESDLSYSATLTGIRDFTSKHTRMQIRAVCKQKHLRTNKVKKDVEALQHN